MAYMRYRSLLMNSVLLSASLALYSCGSSSSSSEDTVASPVAGSCENNAGTTGSWEITDLPEAGQWTRVCADGGSLSNSGKFFRIENLRLAEGASLTLMPFSNAGDNGFKMHFTHDQVATSFTPVSSTPAETFNLDLTEARTLCVEIHGLSGESHIWGYVKATDSATCTSSEDRSDPAADWQVDASATDLIGGNFLGFTRSGSVEFDKIVVTNRASGAEAGNPSL